MWAESDPTRGREQAGRRPALVVAGVADAQTMAEVDMWLRDFLSLG